MQTLRRRHILVDSFQGRLVIFSFIYFFVILMTFAAVLFLPAMLDLSDAGTSWDQKQRASTQFLTLHTRLWPAVLVLFTLLAVHSVVVSHRVAGPLYKFRKVFRSIADGDLSMRVAIRKNDYLTKEVDDINAMVTVLRTRIEEFSAMSRKATEALGELREAAAAGDVSDVQRLSGHVEVHLSNIEEGLAFFKTEPGDDDAPAKDAVLKEAPHSA